jgi:MFS family permease
MAPPAAAGCDAAASRRRWLAALGATVLLQGVTSFLAQSLAVVAPLWSAELDLPPESVGPAMGLIACGTALYLAWGGPVLSRLGPLRTLQAGVLLAALASLGATSGSTVLILALALVLGLGNGPGVPAGSAILARLGPARHQGLIFSVNRTAVPLGGALAGLLLPGIALALGWRAALALGTTAALAAVIAVQPLRAALDLDRAGGRPTDPARLPWRSDLASSLAALRLHPLLWPLVGLAFSFAMVQSCLFAFTVTYLVEAWGWSLAETGVAFAALQVGSAAGRLALGWVADRTGTPRLNLLVQALAAAALTTLFALLPAGTPPIAVALVAAATGVAAAGWNGVALAEAARLAPPGRVSEVASGAALVAFLGGFAAPVAFAAAVSAWNSWTAPMVALAAQIALAAAALAPRLLTGFPSRRRRTR